MALIVRPSSFFPPAVLALVLMSGCSTPESHGLFDPDAPTRPAPTITSITPAGSAAAGMDTITIEGTNFSAVLEENSVYFNAKPAALLAATATQITLKAPLEVNDSVGVRVAVSGAVPFSNTVQYQLVAAVEAFGDFLPTEVPTVVATDSAGSLYAGYVSSLVDGGITRLSEDGTRSNYAPTTSGVTQWTGMRMGPGGYLYAVRNFRAIYRYAPGGGSSAALWVALPTGTVIADLDYDSDGNMWCGGNNANIFRLLPAGTSATFPFSANARAFRFFSGYLYFAARTAAGEQIWRAPVTAGSLGTPEVYFDFAGAYPSAVPLCITLSSDGVLYIGTDAPDGIVVVELNKSYQAPFAAYTELFGTGVRSFAWGKGTTLYATTADGTLLKVTVRGKTSAPYYGSIL